MIIATVEPWVEPPLKQYVDDARARMALLLHPSGQVVAQAGFSRAVDVMTACALAAAVHATSRELGRQLEGDTTRRGKSFDGLHHGGEQVQLHLAPVETRGGSYICLTVFDAESSLGLVRMYFADLCAALAAAAPRFAVKRTPALAADFEHDLNRNLAGLFGRS
ncbi:MAG: hypothetical protein ABI442_12170 [Gemmatimonadaceae bacterium]